MPATITEIAEQARVSKGLVSRLVRNDPTLRVSEETRKRVLAVGKRLGGVRVNRSGRSLSTKLAYNIVYPVNRIFTGQAPGETGRLFLRNLEASVRAGDFRFSVNYFDADNSLPFFRDLTESPDYCDGIVLANGIVDAELARLLLERRFPHVVFDQGAEQFGVNTIATHAFGGMRRAVDHLRELGHERIGFLGCEQMPHYPLLVASLLGRGLPASASWNCPLPNFGVAAQTEPAWLAVVRDTFAGWLDRKPETTGLVCQNDAVALVACAVLGERGMQPGREMSLVGYDNIEERGEHPSAHPVLTTIDNPIDLIGQRCGQWLINQILLKQTHIVHERIPARLINRETTGPCTTRRAP